MSAAATQVVVGRQGIYDTVGSVVGYELLFRGVDGSAETVTGDQMTAEVLYGAMALGFDHLVSDRDAWCNADRGVLVGDLPLNLPPERTVVEVLETVDLDESVQRGCQALADQGYRLALDDFTWRPGAEALLPLASIVKIDVLETVGTDLTELVDRCRQFDVQLLAEKVEHPEQLDELRAFGFELFQGYALERPSVIAGRSLEPGAITRLRMAATLLVDDPDLDDVEAVVRADPALAFQLIQLASVGRRGETRREISSLRQALVLMGSNRVRNWAALLVSRSPTRDAHSHDFLSTLILARACELLVAQFDHSKAHVGFAAGMLSAMAAELQVSPEDICQTVTLSEELVDAAFRAHGPVGVLVHDAVEFHHGNHHAVQRSQVTLPALHSVFASAVAWAMNCSVALDDSPTSAGVA